MSESRILQQLDRIEERLTDVDKRLEKYNAELEFHVARTNQVEDALLALGEQMRPIEVHVQQMRGAGKAVAWLIATLLAVAGVVWGTK